MDQMTLIPVAVITFGLLGFGYLLLSPDRIIVL